MATSMLQAISSLDHQEETRILVILVMTWYHLITPDGTPQHPILGMWSTSWHARVATRSPTPAHHIIHHVITTSTGGMCGEEDEQGGMRGYHIIHSTTTSPCRRDGWPVGCPVDPSEPLPPRSPPRSSRSRGVVGCHGYPS